MSLQYLIDGYNIINHPSFRQRYKKREESQRRLLEFIRIKNLCGSPKNRITVVFDGYPPEGFFKNYDPAMEVIFARNESADTKIRKIIETSAETENIVIVSDDKEIAFLKKIFACQALSVEEFIGDKEKKRAKKEREKDLLKADLSYTQIEKINRELKKIWLK